MPWCSFVLFRDWQSSWSHGAVLCCLEIGSLVEAMVQFCVFQRLAVWLKLHDAVLCCSEIGCLVEAMMQFCVVQRLAVWLKLWCSFVLFRDWLSGWSRDAVSISSIRRSLPRSSSTTVRTVPPLSGRRPMGLATSADTLNVSRTTERSLQSSFQLSITVHVRDHI
jgi:hypothetical protein